MKIRKAEISDATAISAHLFLVMEDILYEFMGISDRQMALSFLTYFVKKESNQYSYQNCWVAENENGIIGCVNLYEGAEFEMLTKPVVSFIKMFFNANFHPEVETHEGELYIDCVGVGPDQQGKGIGTKMMKFVIKRYSVGNQRTLGLLVDKENPVAKRLYLKVGFKVVGEKMLAGKVMEHLQYGPRTM